MPRAARWLPPGWLEPDRALRGAAVIDDDGPTLLETPSFEPPPQMFAAFDSQAPGVVRQNKPLALA